MSEFVTFTILAALTLGAIAMQTNLASAGNRTTVGNIMQPAPGQSSVSNIDVNHFPQSPKSLPVPGQGGGAGGGMGNGSSGGGHNHHPDFSISIDTYGTFDPAHFCRYVQHKHKIVRVCYISQASYAPAISLGFGW
jgi:hypothetical protein